MHDDQRLKQLTGICDVVRQSIRTAHRTQLSTFKDLLTALSQSTTEGEAVGVIEALNHLLDRHGGDEYIVARAYLNQLRHDFDYADDR